MTPDNRFFDWIEYDEDDNVVIKPGAPAWVLEALDNFKECQNKLYGG